MTAGFHPRELISLQTTATINCHQLPPAAAATGDSHVQESVREELSKSLPLPNLPELPVAVAVSR